MPTSPAMTSWHCSVDSLSRAVADQFQNEDRRGELAKVIGGEALYPEVVQRLRSEEQALRVVRAVRCRPAQRTESLSRLGRGVRSARCLVDGFPTP